MVGVLRSKACNPCRSRRKKCDEKHPECGACLKRGVKCVYRSDINFVFFQPQSSKSPASSAPETSDTASEADGNRSSIGRSLTRSPSRQASPIDLPLDILVIANTSNAHGYFLDRYLPSFGRSTALSSDTGVAASSAWYTKVAELATSDPLLNDALLALSLKYAAQRQGDQAAAEHGQMVYGRVTKNLVHRLDSQNDVLRDSTLATVMALTTWESQAASGAGAIGWMAHVKGSMMLVNLRGSTNFTTDFGEQLYLGSLLPNLVGAIGTRKAMAPLSLALPSSIQGPFASYAKLFQILHDLPAILEQTDKVANAAASKAPESEVASKTSTIVYMCQDFESRLVEWNTQLYESQNGEHIYWNEPSHLAARLPPDSPDRVFTTFYCFRSLDLAQQLVFSWTCLLLMHLALGSDAKALTENGYSTITTYATDFDGKSIYQKLTRLAMDILQSLEYFVHPDMGLTALDFIGMPVNLVYGFLRNRDFPQLRWFDVIFARINELSPGFGAFLEAMANQGGGGKAYKLLVLNQ